MKKRNRKEYRIGDDRVVKYFIFCKTLPQAGTDELQTRILEFCKIRQHAVSLGYDPGYGNWGLEWHDSALDFKWQDVEWAE